MRLPRILVLIICYLVCIAGRPCSPSSSACPPRLLCHLPVFRTRLATCYDYIESAQAPYFVPGLPHVMILESRQAPYFVPGLPHVMNIESRQRPFFRTRITTWCRPLAGMICSIPSGLCVGPEGPIIHISALIGPPHSTAQHTAELAIWRAYTTTAPLYRAPCTPQHTTA